MPKSEINSVLFIFEMDDKVQINARENGKS